MPAGLLLVGTGTAALVMLAWIRASPGTAPSPVRLLPVFALLSLVGLVAGGAMVMRPKGQAPVWRWVTIAAVGLGAVLTDPAGLHARFGFPCLVSAGLLALGIRAGETLAKTLAVPLHARAQTNPLAGPAEQIHHLIGSTGHLEGSAPPSLPDLDVTQGQSPLWSAWRLVAEFWVLAALAGGAFALPADSIWRLAAAATVGGGALLVVGAALATLQASWTARGFTFDPGQAPAFWGLGLAVTAALTTLALVLPMPPPLFSERVLSGALRGVRQIRLPFTSVTTASASVAVHPAASLLGLLILPAAVVLGLVREMWTYFGLWLIYPLALPVILPIAAVAGFILLRALRWPLFRGFWARLLTAALSALVFWHRIRLPRRMRRLLEGLGLLRPSVEAGDRARANERTLLERLWGFVDPRTAVRLTYRRFLRTMAEAGAGRATGQSPRAFETAVRLRELAGPDLAELTDAYELARYSGRRAERTWAERARRGWAAVAGLQARGKGRGGERRPKR